MRANPYELRLAESPTRLEAKPINRWYRQKLCRPKKNNRVTIQSNTYRLTAPLTLGVHSSYAENA